MSLPRPVRVVLKVLAGLVLGLATLYVGTYLALATTPGRALLAGVVEDQLQRANLRATPEAVHWGPAPGELWVANVAIELPLANVDVQLIEARVSVPDLEPQALSAIVGKVTIRLPEPGEEAVVAANNAGPNGSAGANAKRQNRLTIPDVRVFVAELDFSGPTVAAHARDLDLRGAIALGEPDEVTLELATGACHVSWMAGRRVSGFDHCRLEGVRAKPRGKTLDLGALVLERDGHDVARVAAHADMTTKTPKIDVHADLDLAAWDATVLAGDQLPLGIVVQGVTLELQGDLVRGSIGAMQAPRYHNGPFDAELVALEIPELTGAPGLILPQVQATVTGLVAAHAAAFDWSAENVAAPLLDFDLEKKLIGQLPGVRIARWSSPGGVVDDLEADADLAIGLSGGSISGLVTTPDGVLDAAARLKVSPITKRSSFTCEATFADVRNALAKLVTHDASDAEKTALGEPLAGSLTVAVDVNREDRFSPYVLELEWDATELRGKTGLSWDGSSWVPAETQTPDDHEGHDDEEDKVP